MATKLVINRSTNCMNNQVLALVQRRVAVCSLGADPALLTAQTRAAAGHDPDQDVDAFASTVWVCLEWRVDRPDTFW